MRYHVPNMSCGHCRGTVEKAALGADPEARLVFDGPARTVEIETTRTDDEMRAALAGAGYAPA